MDNLEVIATDPSLSTPVAGDAKGLIRRYQQNLELSYRKWKNRYKEIEHARRYALGKLNNTTQAMTAEQVSTQAGRPVKGNMIHATLQGLLPYILSLIHI